METKIIDGVKVVKNDKHKLELYVNSSFDGKKLLKWREKNSLALNDFRK